MEGPRSPATNEIPSIVRFLNENLRANSDWSIALEYPLAFHPSNIHNIRIIRDHDQVLSHAVVRPVIVKSTIGLIKVATIGSVVTSSQYRNQGLSQKILMECLRLATDQQCDLAVLWTNIPDFYRKLGFELAGEEHRLTFAQPIDPQSCKLQEKSALPLANDLRFMEGTKIAPEALLRLYNKHSVCTTRTATEVAKYLQIPNSRVFTAWDPMNRLQAYAVMGKGADLEDHIHEWGGGVSKLLPLIYHIQKQRQAPITLMAPRHAQNLRRQAMAFGATSTRNYLGMIKLLRSESLLRKIHRYARAQGIADFVLELKNEDYLIGTKSQVFKTQQAADLIRLLFGPQQASELADLDEASRTALEAIFPLPLWFWGWDSI